MINEVSINEHNLRLAAMYMKMNEDGRNALDKIAQQLAELPRIPKKAKNAIIPIRGNKRY